MDRKPTANTGDTSSIPGPRILHVSQGSYTHVPLLLKPACLESVLHSREATAMRSLHDPTKSHSLFPLATTRESLHQATKTQHSQN